MKLYVAADEQTGHGFEYKSDATLFGLPLIHIAFKYGPDHRPVVARGIIAIGQFAIGYVAIAQFGIGIFSLSQFGIGVFAIGQFVAAYWLLAQIGLYLHAGHGQFVRSISRMIGL